MAWTPTSSSSLGSSGNLVRACSNAFRAASARPSRLADIASSVAAANSPCRASLSLKFTSSTVSNLSIASGSRCSSSISLPSVTFAAGELGLDASALVRRSIAIERLPCSRRICANIVKASGSSRMHRKKGVQDTRSLFRLMLCLQYLGLTKNGGAALCRFLSDCTLLGRKQRNRQQTDAQAHRRVLISAYGTTIHIAIVTVRFSSRRRLLTHSLRSASHIFSGLRLKLIERMLRLSVPVQFLIDAEEWVVGALLDEGRWRAPSSFSLVLIRRSHGQPWNGFGSEREAPGDLHVTRSIVDVGGNTESVRVVG